VQGGDFGGCVGFEFESVSRVWVGE